MAQFLRGQAVVAERDCVCGCVARQSRALHDGQEAEKGDATTGWLPLSPTLDGLSVCSTALLAFRGLLPTVDYL